MYRADNLIRWDEREPKDDEFHLSDIIRELNWCPSIHMPREAARIFLRVTDVRVERLWEIMYVPPGPDNPIVKEGVKYGCDFIAVWENTIKPADRDRYGWDANPWVWVICFKRIPKEAAE